jgi:hypothetical protein
LTPEDNARDINSTPSEAVNGGQAMDVDRRYRIASFDVGTRNLSFCVLTTPTAPQDTSGYAKVLAKRRKAHAKAGEGVAFPHPGPPVTDGLRMEGWVVVDIGGSKQRTEDLITRLVDALKEREALLFGPDGLDAVVIEQQTRSAKLQMVMASIQAYCIVAARIRGFALPMVQIYHAAHCFSTLRVAVDSLRRPGAADTPYQTYEGVLDKKGKQRGVHLCYRDEVDAYVERALATAPEHRDAVPMPQEPPLGLKGKHRGKVPYPCKKKYSEAIAAYVLSACGLASASAGTGDWRAVFTDRGKRDDLADSLQQALVLLYRSQLCLG